MVIDLDFSGLDQPLGLLLGFAELAIDQNHIEALLRHGGGKDGILSLQGNHGPIDKMQSDPAALEFWGKIGITA
jgi:hypothetical protein